jgi:hypothetical protein
MIVEAQSDIRRARHSVPLLGRRRIARVILRFDTLDPSEARRMQDGMNAQLAGCGCAEGGAFVLITAFIAVTALALNVSGHGPVWTLLRGLAILPLLIVAGLAGKAIGLLLARIRFQRLCGLLENRL